ncbi:hypothetical protein EAF00_000140 [Botryotinia globosa]|nr:hypothetical protein EAF00_000140 [Botryotinia globosa]
MGLEPIVETTDHIWVFVDFAADITFPDIKDEISVESSDLGSPAAREKSRSKKDTEVDWWATYEIGQLVSPTFSMSDDAGRSRAFIVGDGCHTHSQKSGQGMNVSMMHSYNLTWKLAHEIYSLSPEPPGASVLKTYETGLVTVARMLIEFDTKFTSTFSGQIGSDSSAEGLTHEQFLKVCSDGSDLTSDCGIEYLQSIAVKATSIENSHLISGDSNLHGTSSLDADYLIPFPFYWASSDSRIHNVRPGRAAWKLVAGIGRDLQRHHSNIPKGHGGIGCDTSLCGASI